MDIRKKLGRLTLPPSPSPSPSTGPAASSPPPSEQRGDERMEAFRARLRTALTGRRRRAETPAGAARAGPGPGLPGERVQTPRGPIQVSEQTLPGHHCHGRAPIGRALDVRGEHLAALTLDPTVEGLDPRGALFVDTETTGLAGGTGTLPFLIGLAWFEGHCLKVQQLLLRRPGEEAPLLGQVAERVASASMLVSYNGKSFDWPLLRTRFVINRLAAPAELPHVDLLHCARRVYKRRLVDMRLSSVEREALGFRRKDDIDSALIPRLYFDYLGGANGSVLAPVMMHNVHDLVALAALLGELHRQYDAPASDADPRDQVALAELCVRARDPERGLSFARAAAVSEHPDSAAEAHVLAAKLQRRHGDFVAAVQSLGEALRVSSSRGPAAAAIHLMLAKLWEHRLRDPERALAHALRASTAEPPAAHQRRIERLERRRGGC